MFCSSCLKTNREDNLVQKHPTGATHPLHERSGWKVHRHCQVKLKKSLSSPSPIARLPENHPFLTGLFSPGCHPNSKALEPCWPRAFADACRRSTGWPRHWSARGGDATCPGTTWRSCSGASWWLLKGNANLKNIQCVSWSLGASGVPPAGHQALKTQHWPSFVLGINILARKSITWIHFPAWGRKCLKTSDLSVPVS